LEVQKLKATTANYENLRRDSNFGGKDEAEFYRKGEIEPSRQLINNLNNQKIELSNEIGNYKSQLQRLQTDKTKKLANSKIR